MERENLNVKDSLQVIEAMIASTRKRRLVSTAVPNLIWGYTTCFVSLLIYFLAPSMGNQVNLLWMLIPLIGSPLFFLHLRKRTKATSSYSILDKVSRNVWLTLGANVMAMSLLAYKIQIPILSIVLIFIGMASAIEAFTLKIRILQLSSLVGMIAGYLLLIIPIEGLDSVLFFACAFFVMFVLPGHYLAYQEKKEDSNHA